MLSFQTRLELEKERRRRQGLKVDEGDPYQSFRTRYRDDLRGFAHECVRWGESSPAAYQDNVFLNLPTKRRVCVRGPHGLGKTALTAITILWFALTRDGDDWKIPTTASAWRQLTKFLWPEIHKWSRLLRWDIIGRAPFNGNELLTQGLKLTTGEAFAMASDNPALIEGAHADHLLFVFDESKVIPDPTWDSAEGAFSTGETYWLAVSTPGEPNGRFYEIQSHRPGYEDWWTRHVSLAETVNAGRISSKWAEDRKRQWGESSAVYQNRVEGNFASSDESSVIPLALVERANERWLAWVEQGKPGELEAIGVDVARGGEDKTVLAPRVDKLIIAELLRYSKEDTMRTVGRVLETLAAYKVKVLRKVKIVVDVIGIGAGVVDRLREPEPGKPALTVVPYNASEKTDLKDSSGILGFVNKRSAGWWRLRDLLANDEVALPVDDRLTGDLTAPRWATTSRGLIQVESKDDIRSRLGRSTDDGDAVVMAFWHEGGSWLLF